MGATEEGVRTDRVHEPVGEGRRERGGDLRCLEPWLGIAMAVASAETGLQPVPGMVEHRPTGGRDLWVGECADEVCEPPRIRVRIVVDERDDLPGSE